MTMAAPNKMKSFESDGQATLTPRLRTGSINIGKKPPQLDYESSDTPDDHKIQQDVSIKEGIFKGAKDSLEKS